MTSYQETHDELLQRAEKMVPALRERAAEAEQLRHVPEATMVDAAAAELFKIALPTRWGGFGMDVRTVCDVARILGRGCVSSAWTLEFLIEHNWMLARFPLRAQEEIFADGYVLAAGPLFAPQQAEVVEGGLRVNGRWPWATGVMHSNWVMINVAVDTGDGKGAVPHIAAVPIGDVTIHDTWYMSGAAATGSNDISAQDLFVPAHRVVSADEWVSMSNPGVAVHPDDPFICAPLTPCVTYFLPAIAIGAAEAALELFKERNNMAVLSWSGGTKKRDWAPANARYAEACANVHLANLLLTDATDLIATTYASGGLLDDHQRAMIRIGGERCARLAYEAVTLLIQGCGSRTFRTGDPMLRIRRDLDVLKSHPTTDWDAIGAPMGSILFGNPPREFDVF